jgi:RNA polymerase sigma-70 factor (ECF subfamily)
MNSNDNNLLHSWVMTTWRPILAGRGKGDDAQNARNELLVRYHEVVYRYFLKKIRDPHAAQELYSNFALKLMESDSLIRGAEREKGRFRNYLRTALHHMVIDYYRGRKRDEKFRPLSLDPAQHEVVSLPEGEDRDGDFGPDWRQELLNQAWKALEEVERKTGQPHHTVLRCHTDNPDLKGPQLAEKLSALLGKPVSHDAARTALKRAREKFAQLLLEEVERAKEQPTLDELEAELIDLELLQYCAKALKKRREGQG